MLAQAVAGAEPKSWLDIVRHDVLPVASAYALFVALLIAHYRRSRSDPEREPATPRDLPFLVRMELGGFLVFVAIILVFYRWLGGESLRFAGRAIAEGAALAFVIVLPSFLLLSWAHRWRRTRW